MRPSFGSFPYIPPMPQMYPSPPPIVPPSPVPYPIPPPSSIWPPVANPMLIPETVDLLTYRYSENMAFAPVAKTYDEAIDNVLELWPDLREFDRDRIHLFLAGPEQLVRVPKIAWDLVKCDLTRYEVVHVHVDQPPPPPQYQADGKGNWASGDEKKKEEEEDKKKQPRSGGFFSSIKRIFWR